MPYAQEVDDSRLDLIRYIDPAPSPDGGFTYNWTHTTDPEEEESPFHNRTISACLQSGAMALFTFEGTRVSVYGSESEEVDSVDNWSSYSINGQSNHTYHSGARGGNQLLLFDSDYMPYGEYTLQIYVGHAEDDAAYYLDYIRYETTSTAAPTSTPQTSSLATSTYAPMLNLSSTTSLSTPSVTSSPSQTAIPTSSPTSSPTTSAAPAAATASVKAASSSTKRETILIATFTGAIGVIVLAIVVPKIRKKRGPYSPIDLTDEIPGERQGLIPFFSKKSAVQQVLFSASPPPSPAPDADSLLPQAAGSAVTASDGRLPAYDPHGSAVMTSDEKTAHLAVVGTISGSTSSGSTSSDEEDTG